MRSQYYQIQTQPNQLSQQNSNTFASINRQSTVSNQSNNSRKRIFQQPQQYQPQSQTQSIPPQTFPLQQSTFKPIPPSTNPVVQLPQSRQLPPPKPNTRISTDNPQPNNRLSEYSFKQPLNFQRKTMIKPSTQYHTQMGQTGSVNRNSNREKNKSKLQALARLKYLNPLARLDYEDREFEVYTRISKQSQEQVFKKIKARNQLANFEENQVDAEKEIDDLIEFKLGKTGKNGFITYFEKEESVILEEALSTKEYCASCQAFVSQLQYRDHIQSCKFEYYGDKAERNHQIQNKINKIYKLLLEEDQSKENEGLKECLIDLNSCSDARTLSQVKLNLQRLSCKGSLEVIGNRIHELIRVKSSIL